MFKRILLVTCFLAFASQAFATSYNCTLRPGQKAFGANKTLALDLTYNTVTVSQTQPDFQGAFDLRSESSAELVYSGWTYYDLSVRIALPAAVFEEEEANSFHMNLSLESEDYFTSDRTFQYLCSK